MLDILTPKALLGLGVALLALDAFAFGFATFYLLFLGVGMIATSAVVYFIFPELSFVSILMLVSGLSAFTALIAWKPLTKFQEQAVRVKPTSDFVGLQFVLGRPPEEGVLYSGVTWEIVTLDGSTLVVGDRIEVVDVSPSKFTVKKI